MTEGGSGPRRRRRRWRFADAVFDEAAWSLSVAGQPVELEGKPLQVLHELLLSAGEADGVFTAVLSAAELAAYRAKFPANLDADTFELH